MKFRYRGVEFGGQHGAILVEDLKRGTPSLRSNDTERPQRDGVIPGRDLFGEANWGFDMVTNKRNLTEALAVAEALEDEWFADEVRLTPGRLEALSYELDGRWRRVYGRPGPFEGPQGTVRAKQGAGDITADFRVMDPYHYDEDEQQVTLSIVPATTGGLVGPLKAPLTSARSGEPRAGFVTNAGNRPTPLIVEFYGPVSNPWVRAAAGWEIGLNGTLAYDQTVTVDPMNGTVLRSDGAAVPGMLTTATLLSQSKLPRGQSELTFGGTDQTGTAKAVLRWRNAYKSL